MTTGLWSVGSVADHIGGMIGWSNISSISGTTLNNMIEQEINFIENYVSVTIDSTAIPERYQPATIDLTFSKVLISTEATEGGVDDVKLGDLSIKSGKGGNAELATQMRADALLRLRETHRSFKYKRVIGC